MVPGGSRFEICMDFTVDLNADLGEGAAREGELLALVTSANIACGFHAGSAVMMRESILAAREANVAVGAHPGFDDRDNFGRREVSVPADELFALVVYQVGAFGAMAQALGLRVQHVKPHGALYNMAARDEAVADSVVRAVCAVDPQLMIFAPDASALSRAGEAKDLRVVREVFADRNYMADGSLVPRAHPQALLHDPVGAADRVFRMLREEKVRALDGSDVTLRADTICVHGDTPGAVEFARELRLALHQSGIVAAAPRE